MCHHFAGDAGGSERVAAGGIGQGSRLDPPLDVEPRLWCAHKLVPNVDAAEKPPLGVSSDARSPKAIKNSR